MLVLCCVGCQAAKTSVRWKYSIVPTPKMIVVLLPVFASKYIDRGRDTFTQIDSATSTQLTPFTKPIVCVCLMVIQIRK